MRTAKESFLLMKPNAGKNSHEVARRIAACRGVKKVFLTSGEFGFVVSTVGEKSVGIENVNKQIKRTAGIDKAKAMKSHYVYSRMP